MTGSPRSLLFACTRNAVRSPMAEALAGRWLGSGVFIDSAGVEPALVNPFAVIVMDEIGLDIRGHRARTFEELSACRFDLIVALSKSANSEAEAYAGDSSTAVEYWDVATTLAQQQQQQQCNNNNNNSTTRTTTTSEQQQ